MSETPPGKLDEVVLFLFIIVALNCAVALWGYQDALQRNKSGWLVALLFIVIGWPGALLFWLIFRPPLLKRGPVTNDPSHYTPVSSVAAVPTEPLLRCEVCGSAYPLSDAEEGCPVCARDKQ